VEAGDYWTGFTGFTGLGSGATHPSGRKARRSPGSRLLLLHDAGADLADGLLDGLLQGAGGDALGAGDVELEGDGETTVGEVAEGDEDAAVDVGDAVGGGLLDRIHRIYRIGKWRYASIRSKSVSIIGLTPSPPPRRGRRSGGRSP
jgi:hypothetical protein